MPRRSVRERLLDAADAVMFIDGAIGTPVDHIVKVAGASPASLYTQFGSKDGLVTAALERRLEVWTAEWDAALERAATPQERLLAVFAAMHSYHDGRLAERWCAFSGTAAASSTPAPSIAAVLAAENALLLSRTADLARAVLPHDEDAARELADQVVVAYCGMLALMLRKPPHEAIDQGERTARALVTAAVGPAGLGGAA